MQQKQFYNSFRVIQSTQSTVLVKLEIMRDTPQPVNWFFSLDSEVI